ncbi:PREDICTED: retinoic acid early transcript 1L protein-like, partial [Galeopterus variegatus]|uniref:Retinoic acid early transcript 1L protein-like n=1 Tax=Galeopterus variegatus TaxID=482537 RepID=A0ABM0PZX9_GALVR
AHSLCYDFTVNLKPTPGQPWCEVQGQVDEKTFLYYGCGNNVKPLGPLGEKVTITESWEEQPGTLRDVADTLKQQLAGIQLENHTTGGAGPLSLQVRMSCQREASGRTSGSWQFSFDGQTFLLFDPGNREWTEVHPGARSTWENDRDVTDFLVRISMGDCKRWLETFLEHWEKMLEPIASEWVTLSPGFPQQLYELLEDKTHLLSPFLPGPVPVTAT